MSLKNTCSRGSWDSQLDDSLCDEWKNGGGISCPHFSLINSTDMTDSKMAVKSYLISHYISACKVKEDEESKSIQTIEMQP